MYVICPVMVKLYKVMKRYAQILQVMAMFGKLMQSCNQIWATYVKICPKMAMLCKIIARIGLVMHNSGRIMQIYAQLWPSITIS